MDLSLLGSCADSDKERDRRVSRVQSSEMEDSQRAVGDAQLRHQGRRPGKLSQADGISVVS